MTPTTRARRPGRARPAGMGSVAARLRRPHRRAGRARVTWAGTRTVAGLELRRRLASPRWPLVALGWVAAVYGILSLAWIATSASATGGRGVLLVALTTFTVSASGVLVVPALTATTLSGTDGRGRLRALQATRLTEGDVATGTLLGACAVAGILLLVASPAWGLGLAAGGAATGQVCVTAALVAGCFVALAAVGLACSARFARRGASVAATYGVVLVLTLGTLVAYGALTPLTARTQPRAVTITDPADPRGARCVTVSQPRREVHPELTWWVLAPNPFVVVGDAGGLSQAEAARRGVTTVFDPLSAVRDGVRGARLGPGPEPLDECPAGDSQRADSAAAAAARLDAAAPLWPIGLVALTVLGLAAWLTAARLVRVPSRRVDRPRRG